MFDMSFGEMILLAAIALIAIGPKQLPEVARTVGKLLGELKKAVGDVTSTVANARDETDRALRSVTDEISNASGDIGRDLHSVKKDIQNEIDSAFRVEELPPHEGQPSLQEDIERAEANAKAIAAAQAAEAEAAKAELAKTQGETK